MPPKPLPYPGDAYIKTLVSSMGFIKKDANGNLLLAQNITIDTLSMDNIITAVNAVIVKSHENKLFARNVEIYNSNGCTATGADHKINKPTEIFMTGEGSHYLNVDGDGNTVGGYSSRTSGTNCKNMGWFGVAIGVNITIGRKNSNGLWVANEFRNSVGIGKNIIIEGNDIHVYGDATGKPPFTTPGVHIIN